MVPQKHGLQYFEATHGILLNAQFSFSIYTTSFVWPCKYPLGLFISLWGLCAKALQLICPGRTVSLLEISRKKACRSHSKIHRGTLMQIYIAGFCFPIFNIFSSSILSASANLSHHHWLVYGQLSGLILSCAGDARAVVDHGYNIFFPFFSALFGRPLAATIDLRVELMTKMTNPWGAQVREIMREMERDREGEQESKTELHNPGTPSHTSTHCTVFPHMLSVAELCVFRVEVSAAGRDATFMQHKAVIPFGFRSS